jgi:hypothetical protein
MSLRSLRFVFAIAIASALLPPKTWASCVDDDKICSQSCAGNQPCLRMCAAQMMACTANSTISGSDASSGLTPDPDSPSQAAPTSSGESITYQGTSTASFEDQIQSCNVAENGAQNSVYQYLNGYLKTGRYTLSITNKKCECTQAQRWGKILYDCIGYATGIANPR